MNSDSTNGIPDEVVDRSAEWVTRIQSGEIDRNHCDDLKTWLAADSIHAETFQRMLDMYERSGALAAPTVSTGSANDVRVRHYAASPWLMATAAAAVLVVAAASFLSLSAGESIRTAVGERRLVNLDDGSSVHLNVDSAISVRLADDRRRVELSQGEVLFDVAGSDSRPFVVETDRLDVTVTGTSFQVTRYDGDTTVAVLEGSVNVALRNPEAGTDAAPGAVLLAAGEGVRLSADGLDRLAAIDTRQLTGWRDGWLYLNNAPVGELVDRLNRQFRGDIRIDDAELSETRISIALRLQGRRQTFERLERLLPLRVDERPGEVFVIGARP